jgi:hypothetical protein
MTSPSTRLEGDLVTVGERPVSAGTVDILFLLAFFVHRNPFIALRTGRRDEHFSMSGKELLRMPGQSLGVVGLLKGAAQQVVAALGALAHNVLVWAKRWLHDHVPGIACIGVKRLVRDVFGVGGRVRLDAQGHVSSIVLNRANRLSHRLLVGLQMLASSAHVTVTLGET